MELRLRDTVANALNSDLMWRYVNELPLSLQAFVLHDDGGRYDDYGSGMASNFDPGHLQPYMNMNLLGETSEELQAVVSVAKERIDHEIQVVKDRIEPGPKQESKPRGYLRRQSFMGWRKKYELGGTTFSEVGPRYLLKRARQRFFFIFAAEEILDALASDEPQKMLDNASYSEESGAALRGYLFVQNDQVHLYPPLLFSFVVGIQVSRIRKCGICGDYFWAGRKDKKDCSEQCGATKRKRRERERYNEIKLGDRIPRRKTKTATRTNAVPTAMRNAPHSSAKGK